MTTILKGEWFLVHFTYSTYIPILYTVHLKQKKKPSSPKAIDGLQHSHTYILYFGMSIKLFYYLSLGRCEHNFFSAIIQLYWNMNFT